MAGGIHHITLITCKVQATSISMRDSPAPVKRTGADDQTQRNSICSTAMLRSHRAPHHLFSSGKMVPLGGSAMVSRSQESFAIPPESIGFWLTRALQFNIPVSGPAQELRCTGPPFA